MKEIIYIQAGRLANHVGTHFWNAQQNYFTYGEDAEDSIVEHDVSFREGLSLKGDGAVLNQGEPTFSPRLLLFDRKSNFGAVSDLYGSDEDASDGIVEPWEGEVVEYRQDQIPPSQHHAELDVEEEISRPGTGHASPRYWSDYNLVYYHPRSVQRLPDVPDWEDAEGDWISNSEMFEKYDEEVDLTDGAFRMFVEECDNLQGIQITNDVATFGSFTNAFLAKIRDELSKLPCLAFSLLSPSVPGKLDSDDPRRIKLALNDALAIQGLCELSTIAVPIQSPTGWNTGKWSSGLHFSRDNPYHSSAILSTHIESATLPLRLQGSVNDMSSFTTVLNWRGNTRLAQISGLFPASSDDTFEKDVEKRIFDLSKLTSDQNIHHDLKTTYARIDVSRGYSTNTIASYDKWARQCQPLPLCVHAPAIELPSSFPPILTAPSQIIRTLSSLHTTSQSSSIFAAYGALANDCLTKHADVISRMGVELDDVKELREGMWVLEDGYKQDAHDGNDSGSDGGNLGEDEEY
ncbi:tubulin domain-containing protein [Cytidiella melzeri]|nr:tubulin domain-containing protein [Cytidiella melzeri]